MKKRKENFKSMVAILVIVVMVILVILLVNNVLLKKVAEEIAKDNYAIELSDGTKKNISERLSETKFVNGIKVSDISLTYYEGNSVLAMNLTNTSGKEKEEFDAIIKLRNSDSDSEHAYKQRIPKLLSGESKMVFLQMPEDVTDSYTFSIEEYPGYEEIMIDGELKQIDVFAEP